MKGMDEITQRFLEAISSLGVRDVEVVNNTPYLTKSILSGIRNGRWCVSRRVLNSFFESYPQFSKAYIIAGSGDLYNIGSEAMERLIDINKKLIADNEHLNESIKGLRIALDDAYKMLSKYKELYGEI